MSNTLAQTMQTLGQQARAASRALSRANTHDKNAALQAIYDALVTGKAAVLAANAIDMQKGRDTDLDPALLDRLELTPARFDGMLQGPSDHACSLSTKAASVSPGLQQHMH